MSTKRKTLKQKRLRDLHASKISQEIPVRQVEETSSYTFQAPTQKTHAPVSKSSHLFTYDLKDIRYSMIISVCLLFINTLIFILIKNSIIPVDILGL